MSNVYMFVYVMSRTVYCLSRPFFCHVNRFVLSSLYNPLMLNSSKCSVIEFVLITINLLNTKKRIKNDLIFEVKDTKYNQFVPKGKHIVIRMKASISRLIERQSLKEGGRAPVNFNSGGGHPRGNIITLHNPHPQELDNQNSSMRRKLKQKTVFKPNKKFPTWG